VACRPVHRHGALRELRPRFDGLERFSVTVPGGVPGGILQNPGDVPVERRWIVITTEIPQRKAPEAAYPIVAGRKLSVRTEEHQVFAAPARDVGVEDEQQPEPTPLVEDIAEFVSMILGTPDHHEDSRDVFFVGHEAHPVGVEAAVVLVGTVRAELLPPRPTPERPERPGEKPTGFRKGPAQSRLTKPRRPGSIGAESLE
jgi:hypothetical protein